MILFACSGPHAGETIAGNIAFANEHAAFVICMGAVSFAFFAICPQWRIMPGIMLGLITLHPAWTISASMGDCGYLKRNASLPFTAFAVIMLLLQAIPVLVKLGVIRPRQKAASGEPLDAPSDGLWKHDAGNG